MPQSYILFQIIINFLNNTWYLKISLDPMMCMALTKLYGVHDNLWYDEEMRNILATFSCSINFRPSLFLLFFFSSSWKFRKIKLFKCVRIVHQFFVFQQQEYQEIVKRTLKKSVNLCFKTCLILEVYKAFHKYKVTQIVKNNIVLKIYGQYVFQNTFFFKKNYGHSKTYANVYLKIMGNIFIFLIG